MNVVTKVLFEAPADSRAARTKRSLQRSPLYSVVEHINLLRWKSQPEDRRKTGPAAWKRKGDIIKSYAVQQQIGVFVETGTYLGNTTNAMKRVFSRLITIELQPTLFQEASRRFAADSHVTTLEGDSGTVLPAVLADLNEPALFWLDGHFSGGGTARADIDTPVWAELEAILEHPVEGHVILIDDAALFGTGDYPSVEQLTSAVNQRRPGMTVTVAEDIMRISPA